MIHHKRKHYSYSFIKEMLIWETKLVNGYMCPSSMKQCSDLGNWDRDKTIFSNNNRQTDKNSVCLLQIRENQSAQAHSLICSTRDISCTHTPKRVAHFDFVHVGKSKNRLETEGGRLSRGMVSADNKVNKITCGQTIYLQSPLCSHFPPIIPMLLGPKRFGTGWSLLGFFCPPKSGTVWFLRWQVCFCLLQVWQWSQLE